MTHEAKNEIVNQIRSMALDLAIRLSQPEIDLDGDQLQIIEPNEVSSAAVYAALARGILRFRDNRGNYIAPSLLGEPAWDMLLYLFEVTADGKRASASSLCRAANVPHTTALRWTKKLISEGLVVQHDHPIDRRMAQLELTPHGLEVMCSYFLEQNPLRDIIQSLSRLAPNPAPTLPGKEA